MRHRRFDKQLLFVFMVLSGLTVLVGLASIGVNRFLISTQNAVLTDSIAVIQRAERVGLNADLAATLAGQLAQSASEAEITRNSRDLIEGIGRIEADVIAMHLFLSGTDTALAEASQARTLAGRITDVVRRKDRLAAATRAEKARLTDAAARLTALVVAETELARLRITAGIWQMYSLPPGQDVRPMLDQLADRDFFAFERLGELSEAAARLSRHIQQLVDAHSVEEIAPLQAQLDDAVTLARARAAFLPSSAAVQSAGRDLALFSGTAGKDGLVTLRKAFLAADAELAGLSAQLAQTLGVLTDEAGRGRDATRSRMQARIAAAGEQAMRLNAALVAVTLLALLTGFLVWSRTRQRVVMRLGAVAQRIVQVARGDTGTRMPISGHDEIGRLEKAVNVLRRRTEQALALRESLQADVLARTADVVAEMQSANAARAEAEEQSRAKTHFLARMSHEIRTPLNGVIGMLDLLTAGETDPDRRARLATALTSARDLQVLTEDILTFSSGEDARPDARLAAFDPARVAQGLGDHLQVLAQAKGLRPVVSLPDDLPPALMGEATRIRQVMVNLISNAVKYTDAGEVRLAVQHRRLPDGLHEISLSVADTGIGMTAEETRHAFDIYGRTVDARRRGVKGVGLGLAIVRQLTDAMGGALKISTAPGRGSSFTLVLRLPVAESANPSAEEELPPVLAGRRVLVVDDHPVNRLVARGYLERMGCSVDEAATGGEALEQAAAGRFDAILIDLDLPDLRGDEVARRIARKAARLALVTADLVHDDAGTRARFGVDHVLTKPVTPRTLAAIFAGAPGLPPARPQTTPETVLREDRVNLGDDLASEITAAFLHDLAKAIPVLRAETDPERRRKLAHRLKGAASNFALHDLCDLLRRIQADDVTALDQLVPTAEAASGALRAAAGRAGLQLPAAVAKQ